MKIFFQKDHSLYKIFKTLEKVQDGKSIHIYIDPEHILFENEWRGKQFQEIFERKHINAFFITKTDRARLFFQQLWLQVLHQEKNKVLKILNLVYLFFFNIKKFHLQVYTKKNYTFYIISTFEFLAIIAVIYMVYVLIIPSAKIQFYPTNQIENVIYNFRYYPAENTAYPSESRFLSIPFYRWYLDYKYDMSMSVSNIKYLQNPSEGKVMIVNKTNSPYSLVPNTRLVTNEWLVFKTADIIKVAAWTEKNPSQQIIKVKANDQDINGIIMWIRWNIIKWTKLYIKNIKNSYYLQNLYAESIENFTWWNTQSEWFITQKDIDVLSWKLADYITKNVKNIIWQNFKQNTMFVLNFDTLEKTQISQIAIDAKPFERKTNLKGFVVARLYFPYIKQEDLFNVVNQYIDQRQSDKIKLMSIDKSSVSFFSDIKDDNWSYIIPTKISILQWYDFKKDINWFIPDIKTRIAGKTKEEAREIILSYSEVSAADIKISPIWYNTIPTLKSRIKIWVKQDEIKE